MHTDTLGKFHKIAGAVIAGHSHKSVAKPRVGKAMSGRQ